MPTVIHINDKLTISGGVEVYISQLLPILRAYGWNTYWFSITRNGKQVHIHSNDNIYWTGSLTELINSSPLKVNSHKDTIFHVHSLSDPTILNRLFQIAPIVRTMHEPRMFCPGHGKFWSKIESKCTKPFGAHCFYRAYTQKCCNRHPIRLFPAIYNSFFERSVTHKYSTIIANSHFIKDEAVISGFPSEKIEVVHYFTPTVNILKNELKETDIVFIGRFSPTKGIHYLLRAFALIHNQFPETKLHLLGNGHSENQYRQLCSTLDLNHKVYFHGWADRKKINQFISKSAMIVFPSIYPEAFGITGIESMMHGKPVVAFDVGGVRDWLVHKKNGLLVPVKDVNTLASSITYLLNNPTDAINMGLHGRQIALSQFSEQTHLNSLTSIYQKALRDYDLTP